MKRRIGLGGMLKNIRNSKGKTMREAAGDCDLSFTLISKIENNRPCRWETVHILLTAGLGVRPQSTDYADAREAWMRQRENIADAMPATSMKYKVSKSGMALVKELREVTRDMTDEEMDVIRGALLKAVAKVKVARL